MKSSEANLKFPVLGFTPDKEIWGFADLNTLTSCGPRTFRDDMQTGMELIDDDGRRWIVRSIVRTGRGKPLASWLLSHLLSTPQSRIAQELDQLSPVTLDEVKDRTCASVRTFASDFGAEDGNENDPVLKQTLEDVRAAPTIGAIVGILGLDSFMAY